MWFADGNPNHSITRRATAIDNIYFIYAYIRHKNSATAKLGTPYYIGKGKGHRHLQPHGQYIPIPKNKNFIVILEKNLTEIGALALERRYIRWYGRKNLGSGILINQTDGGDGVSGYKHLEKFKKFISRVNKGKKVKEHSKTNLKGFILRYGVEEGTKRYLAKCASSDSSSLQAFIKRYGIIDGPIQFEKYKKWSSEVKKGSNNGFFNKKHSIESRRKISIANAGKSKKERLNTMLKLVKPIKVKNNQLHVAFTVVK